MHFKYPVTEQYVVGAAKLLTLKEAHVIMMCIHAWMQNHSGDLDVLESANCVV
eukprot:TRINITY_DN17330_c0_g1_i1.p1 TRINITY_DN17330_c0_g1~~TRINITY_DN17330_c0_g1_i1.p1  ORF type:complete len:53 (-),score=11.63 TRINITY_DN17330_c0_g1_i1:14-172(-)